MTGIQNIAVYFPEERIDNHQMEERITVEGRKVQSGLLERMMGTGYRYFAAEEEQASDLAVKAARKLLQDYKQPIEAMIFASACSDLIEPATANIVQQKLGLTCPSFDVKNACNSVTTAMQLADSLIKSGVYSNILITCGEKPSDSIRFHTSNAEAFRDSFASYSFGDAGVALLMTGVTETTNRILFQKFKSVGEYWPLCTIKGGGSMFPKSADHLFFSGDTFNLKQELEKYATPFAHDCLAEAGLRMQDIAKVCTHQVSKGSYEVIARSLRISEEKIVRIFHQYGNTASASVPISFAYALENKLVKKGEIVMMLGMAAGISISVQFIQV
jgi:acyl-CoA:acyl-CoA alkyltransferase